MPLFKTDKIKVPSTLLKDRYVWPPFSILNTMSWDWQRRKDEWQTVFDSSTAGRDTRRYNATPTNIFSSRGLDAKEPNSVSEFDPYLAEIMYRWFSLSGMTILDPFAGGCVRGVIASMLGREYHGIDLSSIQVNTNFQQYSEIRKKYTDIAGAVNWYVGDAEDVLSRLTDKYDMLFTCPPYYNLERYSNNPLDLSNTTSYEWFLNKYTNILHKSCDLLKDNSFAVIVVSEVRANQQSIAESQYVGLVPDTIHIMRDVCGLKYYNEIILENSLGSLPIRTPRSFNRTRKVGRHHQNVLVFYKGDLTEIENKFGSLE